MFYNFIFIFRQLAGNLLGFLFPVECLSCEISGSYLCQACASKISINYQSHCLDCGAESILGAYCRDCRSKRSVERVLIAVNYDQEMIHRLIWLYKYHFIKAMTPVLGDFFLRYLKNNRIAELLNLENAALVPIPLYDKKQRYRGFNQAAELAKFLAANTGWNYSDCLIREKDTGTQLGLDKKARRKNVQGVFKVADSVLLPKTVILIDDVVTTGSTIDQAARALRARGAVKIYALILAKKGL